MLTLTLTLTRTRTRDLYPHPRPIPASRDPRRLDILHSDQSTADFPREFIASRVEITRTHEGVLFNDAGTFRQDGTVEVISGNGF